MTDTVAPQIVDQNAELWTSNIFDWDIKELSWICLSGDAQQVEGVRACVQDSYARETIAYTILPSELIFPPYVTHGAWTVWLFCWRVEGSVLELDAPEFTRIYASLTELARGTWPGQISTAHSELADHISSVAELALDQWVQFQLHQQGWIRVQSIYLDPCSHSAIMLKLRVSATPCANPVSLSVLPIATHFEAMSVEEDCFFIRSGVSTTLALAPLGTPVQLCESTPPCPDQHSSHVLHQWRVWTGIHDEMVVPVVSLDPTFNGLPSGPTWVPRRALLRLNDKFNAFSDHHHPDTDPFLIPAGVHQPRCKTTTEPDPSHLAACFEENVLDCGERVDPWSWQSPLQSLVSLTHNHQPISGSSDAENSNVTNGSVTLPKARKRKRKPDYAIVDAAVSVSPSPGASYQVATPVGPIPDESPRSDAVVEPQFNEVEDPNMVLEDNDLSTWLAEEDAQAAVQLPATLARTALGSDTILSSQTLFTPTIPQTLSPEPLIDGKTIYALARNLHVTGATPLPLASPAVEYLLPSPDPNIYGERPTPSELLTGTVSPAQEISSPFPSLATESHQRPGVIWKLPATNTKYALSYTPSTSVTSAPRPYPTHLDMIGEDQLFAAPSDDLERFSGNTATTSMNLLGSQSGSSSSSSSSRCSSPGQSPLDDPDSNSGASIFKEAGADLMDVDKYSADVVAQSNTVGEIRVSPNSQPQAHLQLPALTPNPTTPADISRGHVPHWVKTATRCTALLFDDNEVDFSLPCSLAFYLPFSLGLGIQQVHDQTDDVMDDWVPTLPDLGLIDFIEVESVAPDLSNSHSMLFREEQSVWFLNDNWADWERTLHRLQISLRATLSSAGNSNYVLKRPQLQVGYGDDLCHVDPACTNWWDKLALRPYAPEKRLQLCIVAPSSTYLRTLIPQWYQQLSSMFAQCQLGSVEPASTLVTAMNAIHKMDISEPANGIVWVSTPYGDNHSSRNSTYVDHCRELGDCIRRQGHDYDRCLVVVLICPSSEVSSFSADLMQSIFLGFKGLAIHTPATLKSPGNAAVNGLNCTVEVLPVDWFFSRECFAPTALRSLSLRLFTKCRRVSFPLALTSIARGPKILKLYEPPYILANEPTVTFNTLFVSYRVVCSSSVIWLLCSWTDARGELLDIHIEPMRVTTEIDWYLFCHLVWSLIEKAIPSTNSDSWRVVITRIGTRMTRLERAEWRGIVEDWFKEQPGNNMATVVDVVLTSTPTTIDDCAAVTVPTRLSRAEESGTCGTAVLVDLQPSFSPCPSLERKSNLPLHGVSISVESNTETESVGKLFQLHLWLWDYFPAAITEPERNTQHILRDVCKYLFDLSWPSFSHHSSERASLHLLHPLHISALKRVLELVR